MGNKVSATARDPLPIDKVFSLPSPLPSWPQGGSFASGTMDLGGLEICQISKFKKIWELREGGPDDLGATFYEPQPIPEGFFMLGCYAQANNKPLFGWVLAGKDTETDSSVGALKMPVDYTLAWSSESKDIKKEGDGYVWLPIPSEGYSAVGLVVTSSPGKPSLDKIRCVRSDLVDTCEQDQWIWGTDDERTSSEINIFGLRPAIRGKRALGVSVGTFIVQFDGTTTPLPLSCLKNRDYNLSSMPNLSQVEALVEAYSPVIHFHSDEPYFPSSVDWCISKGVQLYQQGNESNPVSIEPNGANLPQGGANDGTYWIDLPVDEKAKEEVKKGDLQSVISYLHIKPMLGAMFTDIAMWIFYPFNGPARVKVQLVTLPLGRTGEHIGDWEHITLRISNLTGELWQLYVSQHSRGIWADLRELEYEGGNKAVLYSSLHGHAFYPKPGLVLQGNEILQIGIRNDAEKSDKVMDTGLKYEVVSADYLSTSVIEPPWLNYYRKWGPKITYDYVDELRAVESILPGGVGLSSVFPSEIIGQDGPTGPKVKNNWDGDEVPFQNKI